MAAWSNFGNAVNVLSLFDIAKEPVKLMYHSSPSVRLAETRELLIKASDLLKQMRDEDILLGKIIEKEFPGFIKEFEKALKRDTTRYQKLWLELNKSSWMQRAIPVGILKRSIYLLHKDVSGLYQDNLRTSLAIQEENSIYQKMDEIYNQDPPPVMTEEQLNKAIDKLHNHAQFLNQQFGALQPPATDVVVTVDVIASYAAALSNANAAQIPLQTMPGHSHSDDID